MSDKCLICKTEFTHEQPAIELSYGLFDIDKGDAIFVNGTQPLYLCISCFGHCDVDLVRKVSGVIASAV